MKRLLLIVIVLGAFAALPAMAQVNITAGAGGIYPAGTTFNGVPINGLQSGYGVEISSTGSALGQFCTVLLGLNNLGLPQNIVIEGKASGGSRTASNIVTFSGSCSINMGDGTAPLLGVPFTATITTNANDQGTICLVLGLNTLPAATVNQESMSIR